MLRSLKERFTFFRSREGGFHLAHPLLEAELDPAERQKQQILDPSYLQALVLESHYLAAKQPKAMEECRSKKIDYDRPNLNDPDMPCWLKMYFVRLDHYVRCAKEATPIFREFLSREAPEALHRILTAQGTSGEDPGESPSTGLPV